MSPCGRLRDRVRPMACCFRCCRGCCICHPPLDCGAARPSMKSPSVAALPDGQIAGNSARGQLPVDDAGPLVIGLAFRRRNDVGRGARPSAPMPVRTGFIPDAAEQRHHLAPSEKPRSSI